MDLYSLINAMCSFFLFPWFSGYDAPRRNQKKEAIFRCSSFPQSDFRNPVPPVSLGAKSSLMN